MMLVCMEEIELIIKSLTDRELALESRVIAEILCIDNFMDSWLMDTVSDYETLVHEEVIRRFCAHVETREDESESAGK